MSPLSEILAELRSRITACALKGENVPNHPASFGPEGEAYNEGVFAAINAVDEFERTNTLSSAPRTCPFCGLTTSPKPDLSWHGDEHR